MDDALFSLKGKTALVTGGVHGLGLPCSQALLDGGGTVIATTRRADAVDEAQARRLDILVNNAGVTWGAPLSDYPPAAWTRVLTLNVAVPFQMVQATLGLLRAASERDPPARIVNIGSIDGHAVGPFDNPATPLGWIADARDIAGALRFLISRAGAFVTGAVLPLDGGASLARWGPEAA